MRVSVIVVSYNTCRLLRRCLASLGEADEVIVVDNVSTDGSVEMVRDEFPEAVLIVNERNVGFGTANNQGLDVMSGDVALLLNSDAFATPGAIETLKGVMEDASIVACGGRLLNAGSAADTAMLVYSEYVAALTVGRGLIGTEECLQKRWQEARDLSTQDSCSNRLTLWAVACEQTALEKLFPRSTLFSPYWKTRRILDNRRSTIDLAANSHPSPVMFSVEQVMGACLMMRPIERFDERFFLYCEDTELCKRLSNHGRIVYVPDAVFGHELGASSKGARWESVARYNRGKELYFSIHHGAVSMVVCWILDRLGSLLRTVGAGILTLLTFGSVSSLRRKCALFARVLFVPVTGPLDPRFKERA